MRISPLPGFDVGEQGAPRDIAIGIFVLVDEAQFSATEETLHRRVVRQRRERQLIGRAPKTHRLAGDSRAEGSFAAT
jgi:hypothetical protein